MRLDVVFSLQYGHASFWCRQAARGLYASPKYWFWPIATLNASMFWHIKATILSGTYANFEHALTQFLFVCVRRPLFSMKANKQLRMQAKLYYFIQNLTSLVSTISVESENRFIYLQVYTSLLHLHGQMVQFTVEIEIKAGNLRITIGLFQINTSIDTFLVFEG